MRNDLLEAVHKRIDLVLYCMCHLVLAEQINILLLVRFSDLDVPAIRLQVHGLFHIKEMRFRAEREIQNVRDIILNNPPQVLVEVWIQRFDVVIRDRDAEHVLVEGSREIRFHLHIVPECFAHEPANEAEVRQVLGIHAAVWIWLERPSTRVARAEESILRIEYLPRQDGEPLPCWSASINALLPLEVDIQSALDLVAALPMQLLVRIVEYIVSSDVHSQDVAPIRLFALFDRCPEVLPLVVEVDKTRRLQEGLQACVEQARIASHKRIDSCSVPFGKAPHVLSALTAHTPLRPVSAAELKVGLDKRNDCSCTCWQKLMSALRLQCAETLSKLAPQRLQLLTQSLHCCAKLFVLCTVEHLTCAPAEPEDRLARLTSTPSFLTGWIARSFELIGCSR